jgi:hypothetical protein
MTRTRTTILATVTLAALAGAAWHATGERALAQVASRDERASAPRPTTAFATATSTTSPSEDEQPANRPNTAPAPSDGEQPATQPTTAAAATMPTGATTAPVDAATRPAMGDERAAPLPAATRPDAGRASAGARPGGGGGGGRAILPVMPAARREDFAAQYAVVYEKNIFLRDRPTYYAAGLEPRANTGAATPAAPRRPEESYVVTGIALQEGRQVAFIENTASGETDRVLDGESVATGKVVAIEPDALEFELNGKRTRVAIGRNLVGDVVFMRPAAPPAPAAAVTAPPGGAPGSATRPAVAGPPGVPGAPGAAPAAAGAAPAGAPDPNNPALSVEERMRLKRAQQGGK